MGGSPSSCWILALGGISVNRKLAVRAGVQRLADDRIGGVGDEGDAAYAGSSRIGSLEFRNCPVDVIDKRAVTDEEGLIGADVFQRFLIEIDFPGRKLRLSQHVHESYSSTKKALDTNDGWLNIHTCLTAARSPSQ